jgi:hypothetical protein
MAAIPANDPNTGFEIVANIFGWIVFIVVVLAVAALIYRLATRGGRRRQALAALGQFDQNQEQAELNWLRGKPMMAPHVVYPTEELYEADLERMTLMGYVPIEVHRTGYDDGTTSFNVRWQLQNWGAFNRARKELAAQERIAV